MRVALGAIACLVALMMAACAPERTEDRGALLKLKRQCQEAGEMKRVEWITKYDREQFSETPEYTYNPTLNTCLYADSYWDTVNPIMTALGGKICQVRFVLDVYTNKTLIEYTAFDGKPIEGSPSEAQFEAEKRRLMGGPPSAQGNVP